MASVSVSRVRGKWTVRWRTLSKSPRQRQESCPDKRTAERLRDEVRRSLALGRDWTPEAARPRPTIREVVDQYLLHREVRLQPRTIDAYASALDLWADWRAASEAGPTYLDELSRSQLDEFWTWLVRPGGARYGGQRRPGSARKALEQVHLVWQWASTHDRFAKHCPLPVEPDLPRREPADPPKAPTWEECDRAIAQLDVEWHRRAAIIMRLIGSRRLETCSLLWDDIDFEAGTLRFRKEVTKGRYGGRTIPLSQALRRQLESWEQLGPTIVNAPSLELTGRGHLDRDVRRAWVRAGVRREVFAGHPTHAFRKAIVSHLGAQGVPWRAIQALVGHNASDVTSRAYSDREVLQPLVKEAVERVAPIAPPMLGLVAA